MPFDLQATLASYDPAKLTLCSIGSHSALEVAAGARAQGLRNLVVTERGRNRTYDTFFARRGDGPARGCVDATLELAKFADVLEPQIVARLRAEHAIFLANRSPSCQCSRVNTSLLDPGARFAPCTPPSPIRLRCCFPGSRSRR